MRVKGTLDQLPTLAQKFLDDANPSACLNIEPTIIERSGPHGWVQILFIPPSRDLLCPRCGVRQYADALFCHRCGAPLDKPADDQKAERLSLSFAYPYSIDPLELLEGMRFHLPPGTEAERWEIRHSATLSLPLLSASQITEVVERLLFEVQGLSLKARVVATID